MVFLLGIPSSPATPAVIIAVALPAATPTKPTICCVSSRLWKEIFPPKNQWHPDLSLKNRQKNKGSHFFDIHKFHDSKSKEIPMPNTLWNINRGSIYIQKLLIFTNTSASHRAGKKTLRLWRISGRMFWLFWISREKNAIFQSWNFVFSALYQSGASKILDGRHLYTIKLDVFVLKSANQ